MLNLIPTPQYICFVGYNIGVYIAPISHAHPKKLLTWQQNISKSNMDNFQLSHWNYHNPSLGLVTKAKVCKVAGQEGSRESHNILPGVWKGVREWTFTPQGSSTLGVGVLVDSQIFKGRLQGSKLNGLRSFLYQWKALGT